MSHYPTGVTVVATYYQGRAVGITANSFASVSLEPPLVLWSVAREADRAAAFLESKSYSISFLNKEQEGIAQYCADNEDLPPGRWSENAQGFPVIDGASVVLDCRQYAVYPGGDHDIIVGEVMGISQTDGRGALSFYKSEYGKLG
jgi:flavin reductase (DIM6/NTAB) family NADH-FMN oxidoreductase RutF